MPQADAPVVGRDRGVGPDPDAIRGEDGFYVVKQHLVLEDASREHCGTCGVALEEHTDGSAQTLGDTPLKGASDVGGVPTTKSILGNR